MASMAVSASTMTHEGAPSVFGRSDEEQLVRRHQAGDQAARAALIEQYLPLARRLAGRYRHSREALDDLEQVASVGLIKAIDRFEPGHGSFTRYAVPTISGELKRHFRDKGWGLHVPRHLQERALAVNDALESLTAELCRSPTPRDVAKFTGLTLEQVLEAMDAASAYSPMSLDMPHPGLGEEGDQGLMATIGAEDPAYELAEWRPTVAPAIGALPEREQQILRLRFIDDLTQIEIAKRVGVSQMHVSRLLRRALGELAAAATEPRR
jgi:RNA polymerase sigma-B factor